jgi:hypothetical protein
MSDALNATLDIPGVDLDAGAAHTIAAGMREVAAADGDHPEEQALIDQFEADLPPGGAAVDLDTLTTPELKLAFVKSLVLVAYADGGVTEAERAVVRKYAFAVGLDERALAGVWSDVAVDLLSNFKGIRLYRDAIVAIGRSMGLDDRGISLALDEADA